MFSLIKLIFFPLFSLVLLILGTGFFTTFVSVRLDLAGTSDEMIGFITAIFFAGLLLASVFLPVISRMGHLRTWILLIIANSVVTLMHALWINSFFWLILRFLAGIFMGGFFVVIESWLLLICPATKRSLTLSIYLLVYYVATSIGQLFLNFCNPYSPTPYFLSSALSLLAILPCLIRSPQIPSYDRTQLFSLAKIIRASFKGFFGAFISGMILGSIYGLAPIYGQKTGLTIPQIGILMAVIVFGGLSLQLPLGKWADFSNRRKVMVYTCFASALFSALIAVFGEISWSKKMILFWLFGGFSFVLYPLSMALACEKITSHQIVAITGGFNLTYGIGAVVGPLLAPLFMGWFGSSGLFYFMTLISLAMGLVGIIPSNRNIAHEPNNKESS